MDSNGLRECSRELVGILGYQFNANLPVLDPVKITRSSQDVLNRILALNACIACSYGFPKLQALDWLERENLIDHLTEPEFELLEGKADAKYTAFQWRVEALWSLTWAAGYHANLDFGQPCSDSLVEMLPDLNTNASSNVFRQDCKLRSAGEVAAMVDLAYCLHWAVVEDRLRGRVHNGKNKKVQPQVIEERRLALEWLICDEAWECVPLDT